MTPDSEDKGMRVGGAANVAPVASDEYVEYETFTYVDGDVMATLRVEDLNGFSYAGMDHHGERTVIGQFRTGFMKIGGFQSVKAVEKFIRAVATAVEDEEDRRAHNAALKAK